jgi:hypothetical protein
MTENHPHPSHYVASPGKSDSVIFAAVLSCLPPGTCSWRIRWALNGMPPDGGDGVLEVRWKDMEQ